MAIQVLDSPQGLHLEAPCNTLRCAERLLRDYLKRSGEIQTVLVGS